MKFTVLLFGPQAQIAGVPSIEVAVASDSTTAADVLAAIAPACPALAPSLPSSRLAVNHAFAEPDTRITATDELALIGLIGGG